MAPYISTKRAAEVAQVAHRTIQDWTTRYPGLARKVAGRWRVDPDYLQRILDGHQSLRRGC
jgi:hypothetical protein